MEKDGVERQFFPNGRIKSEVTYVNGQLTGISRAWHENGVLESEMPIVDGSVEGLVKQWNEDGELLGSYAICNGTGVQKTWYQNGKLMGEIAQVSGQRTGRLRAYFEDGELAAETYWIKNREVSKRKYLEACARDPSLPRYEDDGVKSKLKLPSTKYRRRTTAISDEERKQHDDHIAKLLAKPNQAEARDWLANVPAGTIRTVGEMELKGSQDVIEEGYAAGATRIIAVDIQTDAEKNGTTDCLVVELPATGVKRKRVFEWSNELAQQSGFDPDEDWGQTELFIFFD